MIRRRPPVLERREVSVRGIGRPYFVAAPGGAPSAIVLGLHGRGTRPEWLAWLSDLDRLAGSDDVLAVFPQGSVVVDRQGFTWDEASDLPYLKAVADDARQSSGRSDHGVCVCGISVGARIASAFAAHHAADVDALGAVAGLRAPKVPPERPVPVMAFHGLRDRALPFDGGQGARWVERTIRRQERRAGRPTPRTEAARDWNESVPEAAEAWTRRTGSRVGGSNATRASPCGRSPSTRVDRPRWSCGSRRTPATPGRAIRAASSPISSWGRRAESWTPPGSSGPSSAGTPRNALLTATVR